MINEEKGYKLLEHHKADFNGNKYMIDLAKGWDDVGFISDDLGIELDNIIDDKDYILGIHRTGYTLVTPRIDDPVLSDIFNKGLYNNGDIMGGAMGGNTNIEKTVSLMESSLFLNMSLKTSDNYKGSKGCVIVKIPRSYIGRKEGPVLPIFYREDDNQIRLMPEFIYGYIPVKNHEATTIIRNPNYKDKHSTVNERSVYDDSVVYKNPNLPTVNSISLIDKYNILFKAYVDTLKKYGDRQATAALMNLINCNNYSYFTGKENRLALSRHVIFSDIKKILAYGLNAEANDISELFRLFHMSANGELAKLKSPTR